jgi:arginine-tRNA-protein transferase
LAESMTPATYEDFLHQGWRRSGRALYRPDNWVSCCPALTIRLDVAKFAPTKSQRKLQKQSDKLSMRQATAKCTDKKGLQQVDKSLSQLSKDNMLKNLQRTGILEDLRDWTTDVLQGLLADDDSSLIPAISYKLQSRTRENQHVAVLSTSVCASIAGRSQGKLDRCALAKGVVEELTRRHIPSTSPALDIAPQDCGSAVTADTVSHKKHKADLSSRSVSILSFGVHDESGHIVVRLHFAEYPSVASTSSNELSCTSPDSSMGHESGVVACEPSLSISDKLATWWERQSPAPAVDVNDGIKATTVSANESALDPDVHRLYFRYQHGVHGDTDPFVEDNEATSELEDDDGDDDDDLYGWAGQATASWIERVKSMLHAEYKDLSPATRGRILESFGQFYSFLVDSPLTIVERNDKSAIDAVCLGTYHQHYRISGRLIAVGVVDVLPRGLSSVYLFYDPSFASEVLPLGKYAILREIEWTRQHDLPYYYLGYYIDSCPKMRYKADYHPSEILCPVTRKWVDAERAKEAIRRMSPEHNCCRLHSLADVDTETDAALSPSQIVLKVGPSQPAKVDMLHARGQALVRPLIEEFIAEAGQKAALQCALNFS